MMHLAALNINRQLRQGAISVWWTACWHVADSKLVVFICILSTSLLLLATALLGF
jgi:hypothetical protein